MPGMSCAVAICNSNFIDAKKKGAIISFHSFPKDEKLRKIWMEKCKRKDSFNTRTSYICSRHFLKTDFEINLQNELMGVPRKAFLKKLAVPSVNLKPNEETTIIPSSTRNKRCETKERKKLVEELIHAATSTAVIEPEGILNLSEGLPSNFVTKEAFEKYKKLLIEYETLKRKYEEIVLNQKSLEDQKLKKKSISSAFETLPIEQLACQVQNSCNTSREINMELKNKDKAENLTELKLRPLLPKIKSELLSESCNVTKDIIWSINNPTTQPQANINKATKLDKTKTITLNFNLVKKVCRLCLEEKPTLLPMLAKITFADGSNLNVLEAFNIMTGESIEKLQNPNLPTNMCDQCFNLLSGAYLFKQKYETSSWILNDYISKCTTNVEHIKIIFENDSQDFDSNMELLEFSENQETESAQCDDGAKEDNFEVQNKKQRMNVSNILHRCPICLEKFTALELRKHAYRHKTLKKYLNDAPKYEKRVKFYAKPRATVSLFNQSKIIHKCPYCSLKFSGNDFGNHVIKDHMAKGNYKCNVCERSFKGINHLRTHRLIHKKEQTYQCQYCPKGFVIKKNYECHILTHTSEELPHKCSYCLKEYANPEHLKRHLVLHTESIAYEQKYKNQNVLKCRMCLRKFEEGTYFKDHKCRPFCYECKKAFNSLEEYKGHWCKSRKYLCPICGKVFLRRYAFYNHKYKQHGWNKNNALKYNSKRKSKQSLCYVCGKYIINLQMHMQSHYNLRKYKKYACAQCFQKFSSTGVLKQHILNKHSEARPYSCQFCSKGFKSAWNLQVHQRIHEGNKTHICFVCNKGFLEKSYLKKHLKVHCIDW